MNSNLAVRDQVAILNNWFGSWNRCEQTIALVSLLRRVSWIQARFLRSFVVQLCDNITASLSTEELQSFEATERLANDTAHLLQLGELLGAEGSPKEPEGALKLVTTLLDYVLLLDTSNADTKHIYLQLIARLLSSCGRGESDASLVDRCRQLLSSVLIHPGLNGNERQTLLLWHSQFGQSCERSRSGDTPWLISAPSKWFSRYCLKRRDVAIVLRN